LILDPLRRPFYLRFWLGSTFSYVGDAMTGTALVWLVYQATDSASAVAALLVCYTAPVVVGGLLAGRLLDQFDRRSVMMVDNVVRGLAVVSIPVLYVLGLFAIWEAYFVALIYGFFYMITLAGAPSVVPDLVAESELTDANALETVTFTVSGVLGPPLAAVIIVAWGAQNVMIVDGISYSALVVALASIRLPRREVRTKMDAKPGGLKDAVSLLLGNKVLLSTTLMFMSFNFGFGVLSLWLPVMSRTILSGGATLYGALLGVTALGQVFGAALASRLSSRWPLGRLIFSCQVLSGAALSFMLFVQTTLVAGVALFFLGLFSAPLTAWAQTLRMKVIPAEMRGRAFALLRTMMQSAQPAGSGVAGLVLPWAGLVRLVGATAGLIGIPGLLGSQVKELRSAR
jgi:MFS family permease